MSADFRVYLEPREIDFDWLNEKSERRIVFLNAKPLIDHPQVQYKSIDSPLQIEPLAKEIAKEAVLSPLEIIGTGVDSFRSALETAHREINLILSDASDFGCALSKNCFSMRSHLFRDGWQLQGTFSNVPAVIVGAGPSLQKNGHLLEKLQSNALIFTGGGALATVQVEPHFAAAIDRQAPQRHFKRFAYWETPFLCQSRMHSENFSLLHGEKILLPDSHFGFLSEGKRFESGWTVGTFMTALASLMGCNPIVFVGLDFCYQERQKYTEERVEKEDGLVQTHTIDGQEVWTQQDWLMAKHWLEMFARRSNRTFFNATEGGLGFSSPIQNVRLQDLCFQEQNHLKKRVHETVMTLPFVSQFDWDAWRESLIRCSQGHFEGERAYEHLLLPLWQIWSPIFHRALTFDPHPNKMEINRRLFFQNVIQEHLHVIE